MIKIGEKWKLRTDPYNWILVELIPSKDKNGNDSIREKLRYYPSFRLVAKTIIDLEIMQAGSLDEILAMLDKAEDRLAVRLSEVAA